MSEAILPGRVREDTEAGQAGADAGRFELWTRDLAEGGSEQTRACVLEVEARLHRMAGRQATESGHGPRQGGADEALSLAERMAAFVALHYRQPLSAAVIARSVGLHPNYAMTVFRRSFGTTLIGYVTQHRLSHAQRRLVTTSRPVIGDCV